MARWGLSQSPDCSFCLNPESLLHVVAGCQKYLDPFTWRHDSILNFIAKSLQPVINVQSSLYEDVNGFLNPSLRYNWRKLSTRSSFPNPVQVPTCSRINSWFRVYILTLTTMQCVRKKNIWTWSTKWVEITDVWDL